MRWNEAEITGWGRTIAAKTAMARPERASALDAALKAKPSPAIGMRRSYGDACLNDGGHAIDTSRLDRVLSFDQEIGIIEVEGGAQLGALAAVLAPRGYLPAVMPGTGFATVGGAIAMDVHGKNHHHVGSFGAHVEEITLATPDGARVIGPNDPLFRATIGGLGQTGPISKAKLRLARAKGDLMMVTERRVPNLDTFLDLLDASEASYTVGWVDGTAKGDDLGRGILEEGETGSGMVPKAKRGRKVPFNAPKAALSGPIVRAFNGAYYRSVPEMGRTSVKPIEDYFFPLDKIHDWNRLYGKPGFYQFQCVVPTGAREALREMLEWIAEAGQCSPLAVLKRMGPGAAGWMSFPMEGYTLAIDFPNRKGAERLVKRLNAMTVAAGGRIYFAKDALATAEEADRMYADRLAWAEIVNAVDPERAYETDLVRRLDLRRAA